MKFYDSVPDPYYEHGKHNSIQLTIVILIFVLGIALTINFALPMLKSFFEVTGPMFGKDSKIYCFCSLIVLGILEWRES